MKIPRSSENATYETRTLAKPIVPFDFTIIPIRGKSNVVAIALLRQTDPTDDDTSSDTELLKKVSGKTKKGNNI